MSAGGTQSRRGLVLAAVGVAALVGAIELWPRPAVPPASESSQAPGRALGPWTLIEHEGGALWREVRREGTPPVRIAKPPERIASQSVGTDHMLAALGTESRIVALSKLADDPGFSRITGLAARIGAKSVGSAEHILALRPDLLFAASYTQAELVERVRDAGIPVLQLRDFASLQDVRNNVALIGFATGEDATAQQIIAEMDARIARAVARIPKDAPSPRVLSWAHGAVAAKGSNFDDVMRTVRAINIPAAEAGLERWPMVSLEKIAEWNPDAIVLSSGPGEEEATRTDFLAKPGMAATRAALSGRVLVLPNALMTTVSHHIAELVERVVDGLYGAAPPP